MAITAKVTRDWFGEERTLGEFELFSDGSPIYKCFTLEDAVRGGGIPELVKEWKMAGKTAIPYGSYACKLTFSPRYGRNMWEVANVPGFSGIRIHAGNTETDTEGCILLGDQINPNYTGILGSRKAVKEFEAIMAKHGNQPFTLDIAK
jgi:hypothetical protein